MPGLGSRIPFYRSSTGNTGGKGSRGRFRRNLAHVADDYVFDHKPGPATPHYYEEEANSIQDAYDPDAPDAADPYEPWSGYSGTSSNAYHEDESCLTATDGPIVSEDQFDWLDNEKEAFVLEAVQDALASTYGATEQEIAQMCQAEGVAFGTFQKGRSKGKKGKGRFQRFNVKKRIIKTRAHNKGRRPQFGIKKTKLTLDERRKILKKFKEIYMFLTADKSVLGR